MLILFSTVILIGLMAGGWLFLKRDPERYIHEEKSPINLFFRFGRFYHHFFKIAIIAIFMILIFSFYKFILGASNLFSIAISSLAGTALTGGKELLDKKITLDDVIASLLGLSLGLLLIYLSFI